MRGSDFADRTVHGLDIKPLIEVVFHGQRLFPEDTVFRTYSSWSNKPSVSVPFAGCFLQNQGEVFDEFVVTQRWVGWLIFSEPCSVERVEETPRKQIPDHAIEELLGKARTGSFSILY